jgi:hypothetical protein
MVMFAKGGEVMKYRCLSCGKMFDEPEYIQECMGEFWGSPAFETFPVSPCCNDDFEEVDDEEAES